MKKLLLITLAITFLGSTSCTEECTIEYQFQFPVKIAPVQDVYNIGDTIWTNFNYNSSQVFDLESNSTIDINDLDLEIDFGITQFNDTIDNFGINYFDTVLQVGDLQRYNLVGVSGYSLKFEQAGDLYQLSFGLIPNKTGYYAMSFVTSLDLIYNNLGITDTECSEELKIYQYIINDHADNGYNFYVNNIETPYSETSIKDYQAAGIFSFKVEE